MTAQEVAKKISLKNPKQVVAFSITDEGITLDSSQGIGLEGLMLCERVMRVHIDKAMGLFPKQNSPVVVPVIGK